jgi:hypothetical protein
MFTILAAVLVLHAEPPADHPLTRVMAIQSRVEVEVDAHGAVLNATAMTPLPPFVADFSEAAARQWRFAAAADGRRTYVITFFYRGTGRTEKSSYREVIRSDELTMRITYFQSTTRRLERRHDGTFAEAFCPRHRVRMAVDTVPIGYGLARSYSLPDDRIALREAKRFWRAQRRLFPEANLRAGGGGCTVGFEDKAESYYCEVCRHARAEWLKRHPGYEQYQ